MLRLYKNKDSFVIKRNGNRKQTLDRSSSAASIINSKKSNSPKIRKSLKSQKSSIMKTQGAISTIKM